MTANTVTMTGEEYDRLRFDALLEWREIDPGDACKGCSGAGKMVYSNTSTWHHAFGGQMITSDVCEQCWGSGSASRPWPSWREIWHLKQVIESKNALIDRLVTELDRHKN